MTRESKKAAKLAVSIEARLRGVIKKHDKNGPWCQITFEVREDDLETASEIWMAPLGSRWALALVEIDDDETPLERPKKPAQRRWADMDRTTQAGIRCNEVVFHAFLKEEYPSQWNYHHARRSLGITDHARAADVVREICKVTTRKDLEGNDASGLWDNLDSQFIAWREVG